MTIMGSSCTPTEPPEQEGEEEYYYLVANFTEQCSVLTDEKDEIESTLSAMIVFRSFPDHKVTLPYLWAG